MHLTAIVRDVDPRDALDTLRAAGLRLIATAPSEGTAHHDADLTGPVALVLGGEAGGLPQEVPPQSTSR